MIVKRITLLGHKDHGKSTLIGNMLILTDRVNPAKLKEAQRTSKTLAKRFEPGFILDSFHEEREGGLTIDTTRTEKIPHKGIAFEFIDVPGHEELIKNMMSGASQADIAVLIISAKSDEGIRDQTKRHLFIAKMLGIKKLVVAVNKMDLIGYKEQKFDAIKREMAKFIEQIGFSRNDIYFVPISAYMKDNLITRSSKMPWYRGKTLIELLYINAKSEDAEKGKELRVLLQGFLDGERKMIGGKVVSGTMHVGDSVGVWPSGFSSKVSEIVVKGTRTKVAKTGASVAFKLNDSFNSEVRGSVLADKANPPKPRDTIRALIFVTHPRMKSIKIKFNNVEINCNSLKVLKYVDTITGKATEKGRLRPLGAVEAELKLEKKLPFESHSKTEELGRFLIYSGREFAGIGTVQ
ncbi:MAG: GTP-binding protein [Candidatus Micrarchaeaceae archaeon]|jgi:small GTP-binding protein